MTTTKNMSLTVIAFFLTLGYSCTPQSTNKYLIKTNMGNITIQLYDDTPKHTSNFKKLVKEDYYDGLLFHRVIQDFMIQTGDPASKNATPGQRLGSGGPSYTLEAEILQHHYHKKGAIAAARQSDNVNPQRKSSGSQFYIVQGKPYTEQELTTDMQLLQNHFKQFINQPDNESLRTQVVQLQQNKQFQQLQNLILQYKATLEDYYDTTFNRDYPKDRLQDYTTQGGVPHLDDQYTVFGEVIKGLDVVDKIANQPTNELNRPIKDAVILDIQHIN
jgi:cyclophilin family peptidyl-prolyl cis-trans isomerase